MTFCGPAVLDVCQHFVERWNETKKRKVGDEPYFNNTLRTDGIHISSLHSIAMTRE
jgi:hypothetical protein